MKRLRSILTIGLVLAVVLAPCGGVMAGGTDPGQTDGSGTVDSGHPWDDGTTEAADSGTNPDPGTGSQLAAPPASGSLVAAAGVPALRTGGSRWLSALVMYYWQRAFGTQTGYGVRYLSFWR